ncbi:ATP-dependent RNA helicase DRS1 [Wickerhamiella sorbophila]|uniref:ATP-dependent RNA helicase DRS1 n=1 Tax=Wickerhamiella sorbophila TaxID=45607 RepID=A0A2T0FEM6_9ASCO|nr:ATP-dependent RNA helicase DRS1 [Wickerhamiella sorbophila]PRT53441.1 ATP-dependent RNA helicase DRS1 [Wickerhamiella sorbophila]
MKKSKDDFIYTIEDDQDVVDCDSEKASELNPSFSFGDEDVTKIKDIGWSFGSTSVPETDTLDEIIKRHGGLAKDQSLNERDDNENDAEDFSDSDEEGDKSDASEEGEQQPNNTSANETTEDTIHSENNGFFEDAKTDNTTYKSFAHLSLSRPIQKGIANVGYSQPTPIQSSVIPVALLGKDIVAGAVTGSGKTAAYMIPTLERLVYRPQKVASTRVVILTPTRELALQVHDVGRKLGAFVSNLRFGLAVGGLNLRTQEQDLKTRPDVVVATPGRFIDHVRNSPSFSVDSVEILIVDEADRMLEEGFEAELNEILSLIPTKRQTLLFSATMNSSIKSLIKLSLHKPVRIMIDPPKQAATGLTQEFVRIRKHEESRPAILVSLLRKISRNQRVIVFVARKQMCHHLRIVMGLMGIRVGELHGALTQEQRLESITAFKNLQVPILLCTDLASRGLDIPKIEVVINYELPSTYEVYLHRVGRTARAGRNGTSISLVGDSSSERQVVRSAINSAAEMSSKTQKQKILGRNIDWAEIESIKSDIDSKKEVVDQVVGEEKTAKELALAERDVQKAVNIMQHQNEIKSRPKRTWFDDNSSKSSKKPKSNHQKKKAEVGNASWSYKKTKSDRGVNSKRGSQRAVVKSGAKKAKKMMSSK